MIYTLMVINTDVPRIKVSTPKLHSIHARPGDYIELLWSMGERRLFYIGESDVPMQCYKCPLYKPASHPVHCHMVPGQCLCVVYKGSRQCTIKEVDMEDI